MKPIVFLSFLFFFLPPVFAHHQEVRQAEALIAAKHEQRKKNWIKIIQISHTLSEWGDFAGAKKALELAIPLVIAKKSWAGALQIASVYKKILQEEKYRYWLVVYHKLYQEKDRKWKKY